MFLYYLGLVLFVYFFSIVFGVVAAIILRILERIILPNRIYLKLRIERSMNDEAINSGIADSYLVANPHFFAEDIVIGAIRGGLITFASFLILNSLIEVHHEKVLLGVLIGHTIIVLKNWKGKNRIKDEIGMWAGDFIGIVAVYFIFKQ